MKQLTLLMLVLFLVACDPTPAPDATQTGIAPSVTAKVTDTPKPSETPTNDIFLTATACAGRTQECVDELATKYAQTATERASVTVTSTLQTPTPEDLRTVTPTQEIFEWTTWTINEGVNLLIREMVGDTCVYGAPIFDKLSAGTTLHLGFDVVESGAGGNTVPFTYRVIYNPISHRNKCAATGTTDDPELFMTQVTD